MPVHHLPPQPTAFVGRSEELAQIARLLLDPTNRLLTLVGPGGIGKTRLAIEAARQTIQPDGAYFVPLQPLISPDFIIPSIAGALKFTFQGESDPQVQLLHYLHNKHLLLILDNFEHLLDGSDLLLEFLDHAPSIKFLVTSRERLRLREEWVLDVAGLHFPENNLMETTGSYSAIQLFIQNALRIGYISTPTDTASIARICQLVEGFPLAIELAAAWARVMPCAEIAHEVERNLGILTTTIRNVPEQHRSMRAAFERSWNLLTDEEQAVFIKLSVFRGGLTREAGERVAGASLMILASLVDKSLLRVDTSGRYDLHELLRQYAYEQLTEVGETKVVLNHHRDYFLVLAESAEQELFGTNQLDWLNRLETELDNIRAAIGWSVESGDSAAGLRLTSSLYWFWSLHGYHREGYERLMNILSLPEARVRTTTRARALNAAGIIQWFDGNYGVARPLLEEALAIAREVEDRQQLALADRFLGHVLYYLGEYETARGPLAESLELARQLQDRFGIAWSLHFLGDLILHQGNPQQAQEQYEESVELLRELKDKAQLAYTLRRLALVMADYKNYERSKALCQESLELNFATGDRRAVAASIVALAGLAVEQSNTVHAAQLLGAAERLLNEIAAHLFLVDQREYERHVNRVRNDLDTETFNRAWIEGQSMTMEQAVVFALNVDKSEVTQPLAGDLTERELEILQLLSIGLSTHEVAEKLFLSAGTVRWYINQIYSKLHVHSRVQAIQRARELKLLA